MKKLCELIQECQEKGVSIPEGKGLSKEAPHSEVGRIPSSK